MNAEKRDAMVARVQATFAEYPSWDSLPVVKKQVDITVAMSPDGFDEGGPTYSQQSYVQALYEVCAVADVIGRGPVGFSIVGSRVKD